MADALAIIPSPRYIDAVIFDFDSTLFDTEKKKHGFYEIAERHGYTREEAKAMYDRSRAQGNRMMISIASFLSVLRESLARDGKQFQSEEVSEIIDRMNKGNGLLHGAKALLEFCKRQDMPRCLLSLGVREWQAEKIRKSGVDSYFAPKDIVCTDLLDTGKIDIIRNRFGQDFDGAGVILFNDKPDETADILRAFPKMFAYVRREVRDDRYREEDFAAFQAAFADRAVYAEDLQVLRALFQTVMDGAPRGSGKARLDAAFIDFDDTLYDTHTLTQDMQDIFSAYGVSGGDFEAAFLRAVHGSSRQYFNYTFDLHLQILRDMGYVLPDAEIIPRLQSLIQESYQAPDAESFLLYLKDRSRRLILLSAGNESFQRERLAATTLAPYFDDVLIIQERKDAAVEDYVRRVGRYLFVNDDVAQNMQIQKKFPHVVVVTKRHPVKYSEDELRASGIPYFFTLTDIKTYVEQTYF